MCFLSLVVGTATVSTSIMLHFLFRLKEIIKRVSWLRINSKFGHRIFVNVFCKRICVLCFQMAYKVGRALDLLNSIFNGICNIRLKLRRLNHDCNAFVPAYPIPVQQFFTNVLLFVVAIFKPGNRVFF